jgi:hypothetical protein
MDGCATTRDNSTDGAPRQSSELVVVPWLVGLKGALRGLWESGLATRR